MLPVVDRSPEELNEALVRRMESMVSDLLVISGMTRRGAVLPPEYNKEWGLASIRRFAERLFDALEKHEPVKHPWDVEKSDAA